MKRSAHGRLGPWLRRLALGAAAVAVLAGGWSAFERLDTPVTLVQVSGELTASERARAIEIVASFLPVGVLRLDAQALHARLVDESWIDAASVRRRWPDTVEIRISPEVAVARWRDDALLSSRGAVIEPLELLGADALPRLAGPDGSEEVVMEIFQIVAEVLRPLDLSVCELEQDETGEVQVITDSGLVISLGADRHGSRLKRVATVVERSLAPRMDEVARLDARYDNGVAVAWREVDRAPAEQPAQDTSPEAVPVLADAGPGVTRASAAARFTNRSTGGTGGSWPLPRQR